MPIYFGSNKIKEIYNGGTKIKEVYNGGNLVFSSSKTIKYHTITPEVVGVGMGGGVTFYPSFETGTKLVSVQPPITSGGRAWYISSTYITGFYLDSYNSKSSVVMVDTLGTNRTTFPYIETVIISNVKFERYSYNLSHLFIPEGFIINQSGILYTLCNTTDGFINLGSRPQSTFTINNNTYTITGTKEIDVITGEIK